jgi:glutaredoxin
MHRSRVTALLTLFVVILSAPCACGEIFRWKDAQGVTHYSDRAEQGVEAETVQLRPEPAPVEPSPDPASVKDKTAKPAKAPPAAPVDVSVVMYVMPRCGYCTKARNYFRSRGVPWQEIDITASAAAAKDFKAHGGNGTPLTYINGVRLSGWDPSGFDRALAQSGYR